MLRAALFAASSVVLAASCTDGGSIGDSYNPNHGDMGPVPPENSGGGGTTAAAGGTTGSSTPTGGTTSPPDTGSAGGNPGSSNGGGGSTLGSGGTSSTGSGGTTASGGRGGSTASNGGTGGAPSTGTAGAGGSTLPPVSLSHCKRGEAFDKNSLGDLQALSKGISWWYNWSTAPEKTAAGYAMAGVEFVPMVWGIKGGLPDPATIEKQIPAGAKYILGFNEPNFGAQSNIPAAQAASLWPRIEQIAKDRNLKIGSPSPNYCAGDCNDTDPIHYLDTFFAACTGCQVDFIAAHWYACTGDALKNYIGKLKKYGKPIWITEFSCMDQGDHSAAGELTYMKTAVDILENDPMIFRYSWFTGRWPDQPGINLLGASSGTLTDLGNQYMSLPASNTCGQ
ncbi:MAG TPA: glycoside hydrolase family protein [Polyangia bacterium]|nr:glycoside hydrolase family protein [Polyangia bacterium]